MGARYIAELVCKAVSPDSGKLGRDQWDVLAQVSRALGLTVNPIAIATANEITLPIKASWVRLPQLLVCIAASPLRI